MNKIVWKHMIIEIKKEAFNYYTLSCGMYRKTYIDYTKSQSVKLFKEYLKNVGAVDYARDYMFQKKKGWLY